MTEHPAPLDPLLVSVLACPIDKGSLLWFADEGVLYNPRLRRRYEVRDGVPIMLVEESSEVEASEHDRLAAKAIADAVPETGSGAGSGPPGRSP